MIDETPAVASAYALPQAFMNKRQLLYGLLATCLLPAYPLQAQMPLQALEDLGVIDIYASDYPSLQAAIDAAAARGGGVVGLEPISYNVETAIIPRSNVTLKGVQGKTIIKAMKRMTAAMACSTGGQNMTFVDIIFDANHFLTTGAAHLTGAPYKDIVFNSCAFLNSHATWAVQLGSAGGNPKDHPNAEQARARLGNTNIHLRNCRFDGHENSTLEQCILTNIENGSVLGCTFTNNHTHAHDLLIYTFCRNILVKDNLFASVNGVGCGVQESDTVTITENRFIANADMRGHMLNVINSANIRIENNAAQGIKANKAIFCSIYAWSGERFESGSYESLYQSCSNILVQNNDIDGLMGIACPGEGDASKNFAFSHIYFKGNTMKNCWGAAIVFGYHSVKAPATQKEEWQDIRIMNNVIADWDRDARGAVCVQGSAHAPIPVQVIGNNVPAASTLANAPAASLRYVTHYAVAQNDFMAKGASLALVVENESAGRIAHNNFHGGRISPTARNTLLMHNF
jgi:hypothetical protein